MIKLSLAEIAEAVHGELQGVSGCEAALVTGSVETDSRLVASGALFFARPGEVTDGHLFVESALANGAVAAVVDHPVEASIPQIIVSDVTAALGDLGQICAGPHP